MSTSSRDAGDADRRPVGPPGDATPSDDTVQSPPTDQVPVTGTLEAPATASTAPSTGTVDEAGTASTASSTDTADAGLVSERGTTTIAPSVIAAVARKAATEVYGVAGVEATGLQGVLASLRPTSAGGATADVASRRASIDLRIAVQWPQPIHQVTAATREHVRTRVAELTGHAVNDVDIAVVSLPQPAARTRRRVV